MKILVTGGAGYIGSHTCVELLDEGYEIVVIDNFSNSKKDVIDKIKNITNKQFKFYEGDCCDKKLLNKIFKENKISSVIHFAGFKAVGESVKEPLMYYRNNIDSTLTLLEVMKEFNVKKIVFSSSATVYGNPKSLPIKEDFPLSTTNPYGSTKLMISGIIGEDPNGIPNNLMPYIVKVAVGELPYLNIFGNDYNTHDGTGVRDYIHVVDLAKGHIKAIEKVLKDNVCDAYNLGTGNGYSVLDLVNTFKKVNNVDVEYKIVERRQGDIDACYADPGYAKEKLNWEAQLGIKEMCRDSYNFVKNTKK